MSKEKQLAEKQGTALTVISYEDTDSFEGVTSDCVAIPFLKLLQVTSPECDESAPEYIKDARPGMFINSVTRELFGTTVEIIPCAFKRVFNKWGDRQRGGGFKGALTVDDQLVLETPMNDEGKRVLNNGDFLSDTRNHFVLAVLNDQAIPMVLSLTSTQIKKSKNWISQMQMLKLKNSDGKPFTPSMYSHSYLLESVNEKNDKGSWKGVKISLKGLVVNGALYALSKDFAAQVKDNKVEVQAPVAEEF